MFIPKKAAARNALDNFLPKAGREYAAGRNFDHGPGEPSTVSRLSPWIRNRLLPEWDVLRAVLEQHSESAASKLIDEVCWRTYWKGWLQLHPSVWENYICERTTLLKEFEAQPGYRNAIEGRSGIDCFDAWNIELIETNYLHNHARMWYASIWVHTLKLPWQLGAEWFLRHLLDGDPASNTLSWRWVAGLHTRGKTYLARPDNIRKYTMGRFEVDAPLASEALVLEEAALPKVRKLKSLPSIPDGQRLGLLITDEDLSAVDWLGKQHNFAARAGFFSRTAYETFDMAAPVVRFRKEAMREAGLESIFEQVEAILTWAEEQKLDGIVMAEPSVGMTADALSKLSDLLAAKGMRLHFARHWWDETLYPHATRGFFRFKKAIPQVLSKLERIETVELPGY